MVYIKKGTPAKNQQQQFKKGKKSLPVKQEEEIDFEGMENSDDDIDSDEAPTQKTPTNKGIKGRQSMSEKKVSFSIPGKNSPAVKTPKKDNSIVKKQPTPANKGRISMQEFKGMKGKQPQEDEDDEDDESDDDDMDEDEVDLDLDLDEDDDDVDDEEEEDDDDEEDDNEDEDDEDDKVDIQKKLLLLKQNNSQQNKQKTPVKGNDKAESPIKGQTPKKEQADKAAKVPQQIGDEVERRRQRDAKMLYVGGLPKDTKEEDLKSLSNDIVGVTLPLGGRKNATTVFAFLNFDSEAKAESNYKSLQSKKFKGQPLTLDFVGFKSKNKKAEDESTIQFNLKKLFVAGIPISTTIDQLAKFFKKAFQITYNRSPVSRTATISFDTEEDAKDAHDSNKEIILSGTKLPVLYSRQAGQSDSRKRKSNKNRKPNKNNTNGGNPAKKMKFSKPE